jgi:hypothetical protein
MDVVKSDVMIHSAHTWNNLDQTALMGLRPLVLSVLLIAYSILITYWHLRWLSYPLGYKSERSVCVFVCWWYNKNEYVVCVIFNITQVIPSELRTLRRVVVAPSRKSLIITCCVLYYSSQSYLPALPVVHLYKILFYRDNLMVFFMLSFHAVI